MSKLNKKRVLITGITGFIGKSLKAELERQGVETFGQSRKMHTSKKILAADILNFEALNKFISKNDIKVIYHLAGESLVESGQKKPYQTFMTNAQGTLNVLESGRINRVEKIIISSSSHVYGRNKVPYYEGYMPRPSRPYETSKAVTDLIAQSYSESFGLPVLIPRFVNIYGPGDINFTRLIPKTIKSVLMSKKPQMWGGSALREYLYIQDAVNAYLLLAGTEVKKIGQNKVFNFGSGDIISVKDLIGKITKISGFEKGIKKVNEKRELEIPSQYVSAKKAKKMLNWEAKTKLDEGLAKTIAWYKEYLYNDLSQKK